MRALNAIAEIEADGSTTYLVNGTDIFTSQNTTLTIVHHRAQPSHVLLSNGTLYYELVNGITLQPLDQPTYQNLMASQTAFDSPFFSDPDSSESGMDASMGSLSSAFGTNFVNFVKRVKGVFRRALKKRDEVFGVECTWDTVEADEGNLAYCPDLEDPSPWGFGGIDR
jgi:hypothetical protein